MILKQQQAFQHFQNLFERQLRSCHSELSLQWHFRENLNDCNEWWVQLVDRISQLT